MGQSVEKEVSPHCLLRKQKDLRRVALVPEFVVTYARQKDTSVGKILSQENWQVVQEGKHC